MKDRDHAVSEDFHLLIALSHAIDVYTESSGTASDMVHLGEVILGRERGGERDEVNEENDNGGVNTAGGGQHRDGREGGCRDDDGSHEDRIDYYCGNDDYSMDRRPSDSRNRGPTASFLVALLRYSAQGFPFSNSTPTRDILTDSSTPNRSHCSGGTDDDHVEDDEKAIVDINYPMYITHYACCYSLVTGLLRCLTVTLQSTTQNPRIGLHNCRST